MKYRKKPVIIEAIQYTMDTLNEIIEFVGPYLEVVVGVNEAGPNSAVYHDLTIHTLEGDMKVDYGDFVIKGVHGEFYPCKPDIFEKTYEIAE